jgi:hypothetical protein
LIYFIGRNKSFSNQYSSFFSENFVKNLNSYFYTIPKNSVTVTTGKLKYNKSPIKIMEKRVIFPEGKQKEFILDSRKKLNLKWSVFEENLDIKRQALEKSYRYEYCSFPKNLFTKICQLRGLSEEDVLKRYNALIKDAMLVFGRKVLGENRTKLPDVNIDFEAPVPVFDTSNIKFNKYDKEKRLKFPKRLTPELAEEIGMNIGDGFLSDKKKEYRLKGNKNEKGYYDYFVKPLYKKLFNLDLNIKEYETTYGFELYSKAFWLFKNEILGIPAGRKNNINLPEIIKVNDKRILVSFIRGLFDTDGSISFTQSYGDYVNYYPTISLTLKSKNLMFGVYDILAMLGLKPRIYPATFDCWRIDLNGYNRLAKYSNLIGWSNPVKRDKVLKWKNKYPELGKEVMVGVVQPGRTSACGAEDRVFKSRFSPLQK